MFKNELVTRYQVTLHLRASDLQPMPVTFQIKYICTHTISWLRYW